MFRSNGQRESKKTRILHFQGLLLPTPLVMVTKKVTKGKMVTKIVATQTTITMVTMVTRVTNMPRGIRKRAQVRFNLSRTKSGS